MYAIQDKAHFQLLLEASNSIDAPTHSKDDLKRAFLRQDFERRYKPKPQSDWRLADMETQLEQSNLLRELEKLDADVGTMNFCREALQGGRTAQQAVIKCVEMVVRELRSMSRLRADPTSGAKTRTSRINKDGAIRKTPAPIRTSPRLRARKGTCKTAQGPPVTAKKQGRG
jgi:hypothetical protein